jgi:hypothetical protein
MTDIFDIQEIEENRWQAKYHGNYGIYTVKMTLDKNRKPVNFSCTCPSDYYPCKHIAYVQDAINERLKKIEKPPKTKTPTVADVLKNVSLDELRTFVVQKAKYSEDLTNAIMLTFAGKLSKSTENIYLPILRKALDSVSFDSGIYDDYENYDIDLEILGEWYKKAKESVKQENYTEAEMICKACIEEYAAWLDEQENEVEDFIYEDYQGDFFKLLQQMADAGKIDAKSLYQYCKAETGKKKYADKTLFDELNDLMLHLAPRVNPDGFIADQKALFKELNDKTSREAEKILTRMIDFYNCNNQTDKADELLENNLQIESFCKKTIEKRIAEKKYTEAKKLIADFLKQKDTDYRRDCSDYLLTIAQQENDIPAVRTISYNYLSHSFNKDSCRIYKSTFTSEEWAVELDKLIKYYEEVGKKWHNSFNSNIANLLLAENAAERLLNYVEKYHSAEIIEKYHSAFVHEFPEKTLILFRQAVDNYAGKNLGRDKYEYVNRLLRQMKKIPDGEKVVSEMIANYKIVYKNRRAMLEILGKL